MKGAQLRHKVPRGAVRHGHRPDREILKCVENRLCRRISDIVPIGKEPIEPSLASRNLLSDGAFHSYQELEHNFEQKEHGLNAGRGLKANGFQGVVTFGASVRMLGLVLVFLLSHRVSEAEVLLRHIGHERIIAATVSGLVNRLFMPSDREVKVIALHLNALITGSRATGVGIFVGGLRIVGHCDREKLVGVIRFQNRRAGSVNGVTRFELIAIELPPQGLQLGGGPLEPFRQALIFSGEEPDIIEDEKPELVGLVLMRDGARDLKASIQTLFVR